MPVLKLKLGFTRGSDFSPSSSQDRLHHGYQPALLLLGISKCPPLFPVVKLCLSKLQKPSPAPTSPRPTPLCRSRSYFYPVTCMVSPPPFPSLPSSPGCTHTSVLQSRQSHFLPSARQEQRSAGSGCRGVSLSPQQSPPPRPTSSSSPLGPPPAPQGSPSLGRWQLPRWQTCPRPLASSTCPGVSPRYPRVPWRGGWRGSWGGAAALWQPPMVEGSWGFRR